MSDALTINGKKLLPIKDISARTKYTRDYIAKLAREGAIVGVQVGRQWFVDEESLVRFAEVSELEEQVRNRQLSGERRRERELKLTLAQHSVEVDAHPRYSLARALRQTVVLLVAGVVVGFAANNVPAIVAMQVATTHQAETFTPETLPAGAPAVDFKLALETMLPPQSQQVVFEDTVEITSLDATSTGVLLLPYSVTASSAQAVAELFSDPVSIEFDPGTHSGVIEMATDMGSTAEKFRFVTVPVAAAEEVQVSNSVTP